MKRKYIQLVGWLTLVSLLLVGCQISSSSSESEMEGIPSTSGDQPIQVDAAPEENSVDNGGEVAPEEIEEIGIIEEAAPAVEEEGSTEVVDGATEEAPVAEGETATDVVIEEATPEAEEVVEEAAAPAVPPPDGVYVVQAGDALVNIAAQFGVSVADIAAASGLTSLDSLDIGQELIIPEPGYAATVSDVETGEQVHVVRSGDTLFSIGVAYGVTVAELQAHNGLANVNSLDIGQEIRIPTSAE